MSEVGSTRERTEDWVRYWRADDRPLEAMHAHFSTHAYHRHSHETYSFGVTEQGRQAFRCRGGRHVSTPGLVMAFNPDDPHDGWPPDAPGFTYRMVHIGPELMEEVLAEAFGRPWGLPLFRVPIVADTALATALRRLHTGLLAGMGDLHRDEVLSEVVAALVRRGACGPVGAAEPAPLASHSAVQIARRVRALLLDAGPQPPTADDVAEAAGCSRYAAYRAFRKVYGMPPSEYERLHRLRTARRLLAEGRAPAEVAAVTGFVDQAHLTRWFVRCFGVTPGAYRVRRIGA